MKTCSIRAKISGGCNQRSGTKSVGFGKNFVSYEFLVGVMDTLVCFVSLGLLKPRKFLSLHRLE